VLESERVRGKRTFLAATIVLILFAAAHSLAVIQDNFRETPPEDLPLRQALEARAIPLGPFTMTAWGALQTLNASYTALLLYVALLDLVLLGPAIRAGRLGALAALNGGFCAVLLAITIVFQIPPPMLFAAIATLLFLVSAVRHGQRWTRQRQRQDGIHRPRLVRWSSRASSLSSAVSSCALAGTKRPPHSVPSRVSRLTCRTSSVPSTAARPIPITTPWTRAPGTTSTRSTGKSNATPPQLRSWIRKRQRSPLPTGCSNSSQAPIPSGTRYRRASRV